MQFVCHLVLCVVYSGFKLATSTFVLSILEYMLFKRSEIKKLVFHSILLTSTSKVTLILFYTFILHSFCLANWHLEIATYLFKS